MKERDLMIEQFFLRFARTQTASQQAYCKQLAESRQSRFAKLLFILCAILGSVSKASIAHGESYVDRSFREISKKVGVNEKLLRAICWQESRHKPWAFNPADGGVGNSAFGICQVLHSTARSYGVRDKRCLKPFANMRPSQRVYKNCKLFGTRTNITIAAHFLKSRINQYNGDLLKATAAYNSGRYRLCKDGWLRYKGRKFKRCTIGGPVNEYYLKKVWLALKQNR